VPARAKLAIRDAVAARNHAREERAGARSVAVPDPYTTPFADRIPVLRKRREYEYGREIYDWMCRLSEQDDAEERAARKAAAA